MNFEPYLVITETMDHNHPVIRSVVRSLIGEKSQPKDVLRRLFYFVRDNCRYNMYKASWNLEDYRASKILQEGEGFCVQKSILLAALARAAEIPSRFILTAIRNHKTPPEVVAAMGSNLFFPHIFPEFYVDQRWIKLAPTFDKYLCARINVPTVEFDGENHAILLPFDFEGNPYIEYVHEYGTFEDIPWDLVSQTLPRLYDKTYFEWQGSLNPEVDWKSLGIEVSS